jgi:hypothetical protein
MKSLVSLDLSGVYNPRMIFIFIDTQLILLLQYINIIGGYKTLQIENLLMFLSQEDCQISYLSLCPSFFIFDLNNSEYFQNYLPLNKSLKTLILKTHAFQYVVFVHSNFSLKTIFISIYSFLKSYLILIVIFYFVKH